ncbi:MAG: hypothetical protein Ta2D_09100 [Rickettsiales bacterium]|nr:MAG: hypothetical protein Ta2D_09100 [Rickettsiales bacterium]
MNKKEKIGSLHPKDNSFRTKNPLINSSLIDFYKNVKYFKAVQCQ